MKITYYLNEAPSVLTHRPNNMGEVPMKMIDSGALSRKPSKVTITDSTNGEVQKLDVSKVNPISTKTIMDCNRIMGINRLRQTLPEMIYSQKMQLRCTYGQNPERYIVTEDY